MNSVSRPMIRIVSIIVFFIFVSPLPVIKGEQWPASSENLRKVFGSDKGGSFNLSLNFVDTGVIHPFKEGEAVFLLLEENSLIPYNIGNSVVLEHKRGFRSYYTGLNRKISPVLEKKTIDNQTVLGEADALGFYVKDMELNCFVNPLPLLPLPESKDSLRLDSVKVSGVEGEFELKSGITLPFGEYALILDVEEIFGGLIKSVPQKIIVSIQGKEVLRTGFDMIESIDGRFRLSGNLQQGYKTLYVQEGSFSPGYIRLISGRTQLQVELFDLYGNKKSKTLEFTVRE